jgi:hypothetical protein
VEGGEADWERIFRDCIFRDDRFPSVAAIKSRIRSMVVV